MRWRFYERKGWAGIKYYKYEISSFKIVICDRKSQTGYVCPGEGNQI